MNVSRILVLGAALVFVACGSNSSTGGPAADFGAARAKLDGKPTGDLTKSNAGRVAKGLSHDATSSQTGLSLGPTGGGGSSTGDPGGDIGTESLRILSDAGLGSCADVDAGKDQGSCACESGSIDYDIPHLADLKKSEDLPDTVDMKLALHACVLSGHTADGTMSLELTKPADMLVVMKMKLDDDEIALAFALKDGALWYSEDVDDSGNYVLVKAGSYDSGSGTYTVMAKNGEYDCMVDDGSGTCASKDGKDDVPVGP